MPPIYVLPLFRVRDDAPFAHYYNIFLQKSVFFYVFHILGDSTSLFSLKKPDNIYVHVQSVGSAKEDVGSEKDVV